MRRNSIGKKQITLLLTLILTVGFLLTNVIALESNTAVDSAAVDSSELIADSQECTDGDAIGEIEEVTSLREENVKHFRLADGTYAAVVYTHPVHRKDKDGIWRDIDNTLTLDNAGGLKHYKTPDSRVKFANTFKSDSELFTLSENGYSVSMMLVGNNTSSKLSSAAEMQSGTEVKPIVSNAPACTVGNSFDSIDNAASIDGKSSIVYNGVRTNTAIEYVLQGNDIKENIIISAPCDNYEYQFQITLVGLRAELDAGGSIILFDSRDGQKKYIIPAPCMYDHAGAYSTAVAYELISAKDNVCLLNISADNDWINSPDRSFPVTIDPSITVDKAVSDSYTHLSYPDNNYGLDEELWVSNYRTSYICMDIPNLPSGATFNYAYLYVSYYYHVTSGNLLAGAYQVLEEWDEDTITYNNAPAVSSTQLDTDILAASENITESSSGSACFIITDAVGDWYDDRSSNFGIAIKRESSTTYTNGSVILKSYEADDDDYAYISVNYTYYVPDGVYALQTYSNSTRWMTIEGDSVWEGNHIQQMYLAPSPASASVFDRSSLFKISRASGTSRYIIRSMLNNNLSFGVSGTEIITKEIPCADSDVAYADTFYIEWDGYGFLIRPYGSSKVITMTSASSANLTVIAKSSANSYARWKLVRYTGVNKHGAVIHHPANMDAGTTGTFTPIAWSTYIDYNTPRLVLQSGYANHATITWDANTRQATVSLHDNGIFNATLHLYNGSQTARYSLTFAFTVTLAIDEGIYFFKNREVGKYIQVDNDDAPGHDTSGSIMELWDYNGRDYQKWNLVHVGDGYYEILSVKSGMALCVPSGSADEDEVALIQQPYSNLSRKKWEITKSSSGAYILRPKSGESNDSDWCMCAGDQFLWITDGLNVEQRKYVNNDSYKDEWYLEFDATSTSTRLPNGDAQNKTNWCWAACSKMVGEHNGGDGALSVTPALLSITSDVHSFGGVLFYGETSTGALTADAGQREIVIDVHGDDDNHSGSNANKVKALQLASINDMDVGTWGTGSLSTANITAMNNELTAGRWVIGNVFTNSNWSGHSIVIMNYNNTTQIYTFWDPWTDSNGTFTRTQLLNNTIHTVSNTVDRTLAWVQYCN